MLIVYLDKVYLDKSILKYSCLFILSRQKKISSVFSSNLDKWICYQNNHLDSYSVNDFEIVDTTFYWILNIHHT